MLKSALVAMTILGCNCEQNTCEYIRTADVATTDMSDCQARMKTEIQRTNAEYPLIVAVCEPTPAPQSVAASDGNVGAETVRLADVQAPEPAKPRSIMVRARQRYSAIMGSAGEGLDGVLEFVTIPGGWLQRQISAVEDLRW
jgi:hypothetical protein